jgi:hypothetical protein
MKSRKFRVVDTIAKNAKIAKESKLNYLRAGIGFQWVFSSVI